MATICCKKPNVKKSYEKVTKLVTKSVDIINPICYNLVTIITRSNNLCRQQAKKKAYLLNTKVIL